MNDVLDAQLAFEPQVEGSAGIAPVLVCGGMGGSAFPARVLRFLGAAPYVALHQEYGIPARLLPGARYVALSYSGETAETLSFARAALDAGLPLSVISSGGALLALAKEHHLPFVAVPSGFVPREAIVMMTKALLALIGEESLFQASPAEPSFDAEAAAREGEALASGLAGAVPVIYGSVRNEVLAHLAKILFNETAKIPSFSNILPELNHNEMQGFGRGTSAARADGSFVAIFLRDGSDDERVKRRMDLTEELLAGNGVRTVRTLLPDAPRTGTFLHGWWLMRAAARSLADRSGIDPDATPLIDSFKKLL